MVISNFGCQKENTLVTETNNSSNDAVPYDGYTHAILTINHILDDDSKQILATPEYGAWYGELMIQEFYLLVL